MFQVDSLYQRYPALRSAMLIPLLLIGLVGMLGLIMLGQAFLATAIILTALLTLAILAWPELGTLVVVFVLFTNAAVIAVKFHNVPSLIGAALPALLVFPLATNLVFRREKLVVSTILLPIFLFLAVQVVSALFSDYKGTSIDNVQTFVLEGLGLFFLLTNVVRTPETLRRVTWALLIAGALIGGLSVYQQITKTFDNTYWGFAQPSEAVFNAGAKDAITGAVNQWRLAGQIGEKNRYAQVMLMLVPLGMFRVWGERKLTLRALAGLCTALSAAGAALAFSRGAAVGFVLMLVIMVFMRYIKIYQVLLIALGLYLLLLALPQYRDRLVSLQGFSALFSDGTEAVGSSDGATLSRLTEMGAAGLVFLDHPVIGVGPGTFPNYYQQYSELIGLRTLNADRQAHDLYLSIAAETGIAGLACFLMVLYVTLMGLARARKRWLTADPEIANMATAYMLSIVTYLTTGVFLHFAFIRYFWMFIALAGAVVYIASQREQHVAVTEAEATMPNAALVRA